MGGDEELDGVLARPQATFGGEDLLPTLAEKAAALLQSIAIAHPFIDGNKRAAIGGGAALSRTQRRVPAG